MLLELLRAGNVDSSGSKGVGRGEGKWMLVRSGREPPVLCVAGIRAVVFSWSADGKMLHRGEEQRQKATQSAAPQSSSAHREDATGRKLSSLMAPSERQQPAAARALREGAPAGLGQLRALQGAQGKLTFTTQQSSVLCKEQLLQTYLIPGTSQDLGLDDPVCKRKRRSVKAETLLEMKAEGGLKLAASAKLNPFFQSSCSTPQLLKPLQDIWHL